MLGLLTLDSRLETRKLVLLLVVIFAMSLTSAWGGEKMTIAPGPKDKCPVCGMFVAKYPDFIAAIVFRDGSKAFFDGAKDLFKYRLQMEKYARKKNPDDIASILVTDYYRLVLIDAARAWYVKGSDVYGPMGRELIPFEKEADAKEFLRDHKGDSILRFRDVSRALITSLD